MMSKADVQGPRELQVGSSELTSMSSLEAELEVAALAMKEAVFCSNMMTELGFGQQFGQVRLNIDNTATLHFISNRAFSSRTKHIALRFCYIRGLVDEGKVSILYIPTEHQLADLGTKHLDKQSLRYMLDRIKNFGK